MLNLDPGLLNQDKIRSDKRRRLFLYATLPLVFLIIATIFFIRTGIYNIMFSVGVAGGSYGLPTTITNAQKIGNLIEPYLPYYNSGYLKLIQANSREILQSAETDFSESLKHNPPEYSLCSIYGNLSYSIELQGDLSFNEESYNDAIVLYNRAEALLFENGCASKDGESGKDEMAEAAKERIEEKRAEAVDSANNTRPGDDGDGNNGDSGNEEISDDQLQQIQQQQQDAINNAAGNPYQAHGVGNSTPGASFGDPNF